MLGVHVKKYYEGKTDQFIVVRDCKIPGTAHTIPRGMITDGASIPRLLWIFINPYGVIFEPSVKHDFYYIFTFHNLNRREADIEFLDDIKKTKIPKFICYTIYFIIRIFGKSNWNKYRKIK